MDIILEFSDKLILNSFYEVFNSTELYNPNSTKRQIISLWLIAMFGVNLLYFTLATISYYYLFDKRLLKHPKVGDSGGGGGGGGVVDSLISLISISQLLVFEKSDFKGNMGMIVRDKLVSGSHNN